ncbi:con-Ins Im2-like isoform X2 [Gigantopelta aegis]|nr:con-Ins Im2-like isoform X2 [Gigantopelta aegis]
MSMEGFTKCPLVLIGVLCLQLGPVFTYYEKTCTLETRREGPANHGVCGSRLSEVLSMVCQHSGGFREKWFRKRDTDYSGASRIQDITVKKKGALSYLTKRGTGYGEQGLTCECCYNQCSYRELRQYCKETPRRGFDLLRKRSIVPSGDVFRKRAILPEGE